MFVILVFSEIIIIRKRKMIHENEPVPWPELWMHSPTGWSQKGQVATVGLLAFVDIVSSVSIQEILLIILWVPPGYKDGRFPISRSFKNVSLHFHNTVMIQILSHAWIAESTGLFELEKCWVVVLLHDSAKPRIYGRVRTQTHTFWFLQSDFIFFTY